MPPQRTQSSSILCSNELDRLKTLISFENEARLQGYQVIAGVDEAGRGPLAGPVVAAACIVPDGVFFAGINDSKKLLPRAREILFQQIIEQTTFGLGIVSSSEIDQINIYQATALAMLQAIDALPQKPHFLLIDGMDLRRSSIPYQKIIQGDGKSQSIAAASILAKVTRDRMMVEFDEQWPQYGFRQHKGYGTAQHVKAIEEYGPCKIHRMTFAPLKTCLHS